MKNVDNFTATLIVTPVSSYGLPSKRQVHLGDAACYMLHACYFPAALVTFFAINPDVDDYVDEDEGIFWQSASSSRLSGSELPA